MKSQSLKEGEAYDIMEESYSYSDEDEDKYTETNKKENKLHNMRAILKTFNLL